MKSTHFHHHLRDYFEVYLPKVRGYSNNTILSYKDTFRLLFAYMEANNNLKPYLLNYKHFSGSRIEAYLEWLETDRRCSVSSRNQRLAAIASFFKYASRKSVDALNICNDILDIPAKKAPKSTIAYLTLEEIQLLFQMPDQRKRLERRDLVLMCLMYDSGARVQEMCDLVVRDIRFKTPPTLRLRGKGNMVRIVPLTSRPANLVLQYIKESSLNPDEHLDSPLFSSQTRDKMTPACIRYMFSKYLERAKKKRPDLFQAKTYSPHSTRHSKAVHMLEAGIDLIYIRDFLGHASIKTTEIYATVSQSLVNNVLRERKLPNIIHVSLESMRQDSIPDYLKK